MCSHQFYIDTTVMGHTYRQCSSCCIILMQFDSIHADAIGIATEAAAVKRLMELLLNVEIPKFAAKKDAENIL